MHDIDHAPNGLPARAWLAMVIAVLGALALVYTVGLIVFYALYLVVPQDNGPMALAQILLPHVTLVALLFVPLAARATAIPLRVGLLILLVLFAAKFGGEWLSIPPTSADGPRIGLLTWNVEVGSRPPEDVVEILRARSADLVVLQELTPEAAEAIENDADLRQRFPFRAFHPDPTVAGLGVLTRFPIEEDAYLTRPVRQEVTLDIDGATLFLINGHPYRGDIDGDSFYQTDSRNEDLELIRGRADEAIEAGTRTVIVGDFNTAPTEPAFGRLTAGLADAHVEVGLGPGWTWRPSRFEGLGIGFLRIDLVLGGPGVAPISTGTDCSQPGDHCLLEATLQLR